MRGPVHCWMAKLGESGRHATGHSRGKRNSGQIRKALNPGWGTMTELFEQISSGICVSPWGHFIKLFAVYWLSKWSLLLFSWSKLNTSSLWQHCLLLNPDDEFPHKQQLSEQIPGCTLKFSWPLMAPGCEPPAVSLQGCLDVLLLFP